MTTVRGTLDDIDTLRHAATETDGVVHLASKHDIAFSGDFRGAVDAAIETFGEALAGTAKPLVVAAGTLGLTPGRVATERDEPLPGANPRIPKHLCWRAPSSAKASAPARWHTAGTTAAWQ